MNHHNQPVPHSSRQHRDEWVRRGCILLFCTLLAPALRAQGHLRTLTGTVTDHGHEPLRGAVVEVQDEVTGVVVSFITDRAGNFSFKRLSSEDDYKVWATFRQHRSKNHEMSHFDSKPEKVIAIEITLD